MSGKSYIRFFGKLTVYGWKAWVISELYFALHILGGILVGYWWWGAA